MKTQIALLTLLISYSVFAQFDPIQKLEEGKKNYDKSLANHSKNLEKLEQLKHIMTDKASLLSRITPTDVMQSCSEKLNATADQHVNREISEARYRKAELDKYHLNLQQNVTKYLSAQECSQCDEEVRSETLKKYAEKINNDVYALSFIGKLHINDHVNYIEENAKCSFDSFFRYQDSEKFERLKDWGFGQYKNVLTASEIIDGKYADAIDLVVKKAPVTVKRDAKKTGKTVSDFKNGEVRIALIYDWNLITGYDNVTHPEIGNPMKIIHQALKKNQ